MNQDVSKEGGRTSFNGAVFEAIFNSMTTPLLLLSPKLIMLACNEARLRATGTTREQTIGRPLFDLFPDNPNDPAAGGVHNLRMSLERVLREKVADTMAIQKYDIRRPNSNEFEERYWSPVNFPVLGKRGEVEFIVHRVEDVTDFVRGADRSGELQSEVFLRTQEVQGTNLELKISKEELERKIAERTAELADRANELLAAQSNLITAKEEAEHANALKSAFLANMSHEIRTPLAAILGFSSLLRDENLDSTSRQKFFDTIVSNGNALTRIVDDILDLARVEAGRMEIQNQEITVGTLISEVIDLFLGKAEKKGLKLVLEIHEGVPEKIFSDAARLRQILVNLVGNAVKFTARGHVRLDLHAKAQADGKSRIEIDIEDTGIGLSESQQGRLFQPFVQADNSASREFGGTGLGLALSRRLAAALGGDVFIKRSVPAEGSTFTLTFTSLAAVPVSPSDSSLASNASTRPENTYLRGLRVLVVDDSKDNLFLVERLLIKAGAIVATATDGAAGVHRAEAEHFDVVLMDIQMPRMDGYQAIKALRQSGFRAPVIALTAHAMFEEREKTAKTGFSAHVTKPLNNAELLTTIARICRPCVKDGNC